MTVQTPSPDSAATGAGRCPTIEQLIRGACGELSPAEHERVLAHVRLCPTCARAWFSAGGRLQPAEPVQVASATSSATPLSATAPPIAATSAIAQPVNVAATPAPKRRNTALILLVVALAAVAVMAFGIALVAHYVQRQLVPVASATRAWRAPRAATATATNPSLSPASIPQEIAALPRIFASLHAINEQARAELARPPGRPRVQVFQLDPTNGAPSSRPVAASRRVTPFAILLRFPSAPVASIEIVSPAGRSIWQHPVAAGLTRMKIDFPPMSLPTGTYRARALGPSGDPVAEYLFAVID